MARKVIKEQLDFAAKTEAEWEAEDLDHDYQNKMQTRMRDVGCLIFFQEINHIEALFPGSSSHRSFSSDYWFAILISPLVEMYLRDLSPEEQAEYRKTLPDFTLKIKDRGSNSTKED